ncbi:hypothetical protein OG558_42320 [Kribbella sp. NBC_01510]|uniref:hypothetical protein n=1 Tax=Kribbella sp. NBC_01510 TaxID=2903581 RepID=UPI003867650D
MVSQVPVIGPARRPGRHDERVRSPHLPGAGWSGADVGSPAMRDGGSPGEGGRWQPGRGRTVAAGSADVAGVCKLDRKCPPWPGRAGRRQA